MNAQETLAVIAALKNAGAIHFKSHDFEITLLGNAAPAKVQSVPVQVPSTPIMQQAQPDPILSPEQEAKIKEANAKIQELITTMSMTPEELANKMFEGVE